MTVVVPAMRPWRAWANRPHSPVTRAIPSTMRRAPPARKMRSRCLRSAFTSRAEERLIYDDGYELIIHAMKARTQHLEDLA